LAGACNGKADRILNTFDSRKGRGHQLRSF
jgi:hypothetical protein